MIYQVLLDHKICNTDSIRLFQVGIRDDPNACVYKCKNSGVYFLLGETEKPQTKPASLETTLRDDVRRKEQYIQHIGDNRWLDFGTGNGGILKQAIRKPGYTVVIDKQRAVCTQLKAEGHQVFTSLDVCPEKDFRYITMFHVLEHLDDPIEILKQIKDCMSPEGTIIIEVPNADDILLSFYESEAFKRFNFWSEHKMVHTRKSLMRFLELSGFNHIKIYGVQRYPFINHAYWLAKGKPNGHKEWAGLFDTKLEEVYQNTLKNMGKTDTLIAMAQKPKETTLIGKRK